MSCEKNVGLKKITGICCFLDLTNFLCFRMRNVLFRPYSRIQTFYVAGNASFTQQQSSLPSGNPGHVTLPFTFNYSFTHTRKIKIFDTIYRTLSTWLQPIFLSFAYCSVPAPYHLANSSPHLFLWRCSLRGCFPGGVHSVLSAELSSRHYHHSSSPSLGKSYFNIQNDL